MSEFVCAECGASFGYGTGSPDTCPKCAAATAVVEAGQVAHSAEERARETARKERRIHDRLQRSYLRYDRLVYRWNRAEGKAQDAWKAWSEALDALEIARREERRTVLSLRLRVEAGTVCPVCRGLGRYWLSWQVGDAVPVGCPACSASALRGGS